MMSILKKQPRHEVISIRLSEDRLKLLERYQKLLSDQLGRSCLWVRPLSSSLRSALPEWTARRRAMKC